MIVSGFLSLLLRGSSRAQSERPGLLTAAVRRLIPCSPSGSGVRNVRRKSRSGASTWEPRESEPSVGTRAVQGVGPSPVAGGRAGRQGPALRCEGKERTGKERRSVREQCRLKRPPRAVVGPSGLSRYISPPASPLLHPEPSLHLPFTPNGAAFTYSTFNPTTYVPPQERSPTHDRRSVER